MCAKSDEQILYESYLKLGEKIMTQVRSKCTVSFDEDKELIGEINSKLPLMLVYLVETNILSLAEVQKQLIKAKEIYVQFFKIKGRNPECIMGHVSDKMNRLIHAIARHEASMLENIRKQESAGENIDLEKIFDKEKNLKHLGTTPIRNVIREAMAEKQRQAAYNSIAIKKVVDKNDENTVTVFVDESIRSIKWVEGGKTGSYSYIICKGYLTSERNIDNTRIIAQGIDYMHETNHIERLTESAIGKVMVTLAYDFNFKGNVLIFTDNISAMKQWATVSKNARLAQLFESVQVAHISRKNNTRADKLVKSYTYLGMSTRTYNEVATKVRAYDRMQEKSVLNRVISYFRNLFDFERLDAC